MKFWKNSICWFLALAAFGLTLNGCGSKNNSATTITVSLVSSVGNTLILGQSTTLTATVVGSTTTTVTWVGCTFTTTPTPTTANPNPKASTPAACPQDSKHTPADPNFTIFGNLTNEQSTGTATFTAPQNIPDPNTYPGLAIIITVNAVADTKKTATINLFINSGIVVSLTPTTAAVPTKEQQPFIAVLTNDTKGVTWLLTQSTPTAAASASDPNPYKSLTTCTVSGNATGCGSIDANGIYTAPDVVPTDTVPSKASTTPTIVTVVATSVTDSTRFALGTITITQGGPIQFNGLLNTIAPQGATYWDIYLNAPNISSSSQIHLSSSAQPVSPGQVKVLFPIPTSTVTNPTSTGARVRLFAGDLVAAQSVTVSITDPGQPVTTCTGNPLPTGCTAAGVFIYNIVPVRPTAVASSPTNIIQGAVTSGSTDVTIDGGYFGPGGQDAIVTFQGTTLPSATNSNGSLSNSRQLQLQFPSNFVNSNPPGLYALSTAPRTTPLPFFQNPAVTDLAVFPNYSANPPSVMATLALPAGSNPSAIDIDPNLGVAVVAETGANAVQFYSVAAGSLTPLGGPVGVGKLPTGLSVNRTNHTVAVINYGDQSVTVLPIPGVPPAVGTPFTLDISNALQGATPAPVPYSIGVDPDTNMGIVAYSSTQTATAANLGFLVNLNSGANSFGCINDVPPAAPSAGPCLFAQVTLNTGAYPQVAMSPHGHLALVSPGGSGILRGVDVTKRSTSAIIKSLTLAAGLVTVTTTTSNGLVPGNAGTVLITGVPKPGTTGTNGNSTTADFNGVFVVQTISDTSFAYSLSSTSSGTVTPSGATVFYNNPNLIFGGISQTTQGIAINPITSTAALADVNATGSNGPEINLLNALDQNVSSISFFAGCTFYTTTCSNAPELLGTADIAWQPYSDSIVSYNPGQNNQLSISDPVSRRRYALLQLNGTGTALINSVNLTLWGGLAVDPATNQAIVVMSGSNTINLVNLGPLKPAQITEILVPSPNPGPGVIGGIPNATVPQATLTSANPLAGVQIFGSGFDAGTSVLLDGQSIGQGNVLFVSNRELSVTIPAANLSFPRRYALSVQNSSGVQSNATDFFVMQAVDMSGACTTGPAQPSSVAIADQLANGPFSPVAVVTNSGCNNISVVDVNPTVTANGQTQINPNFGKVLHTIAVGANPQGIAVSEPFGLAVVANNTDGTASVVDLTKNALAVPSVSTGTNPTGVAINDATGAAVVTNTGSNTVSEINLGLLFGTTPATSLTPVSIGGFQQPTAVAIDPDRGTANQGLAVVTSLQLVSGAAPTGALQGVDIGASVPVLSTTVTTGTVTAPTTGIVFDPTVATGSSNNGVFYASSSGGNVIAAYNPDTGFANPVNVGINPTALAINTETGAILTANFGGKTTSLVDTHASPLATVKTIGLPGSAQFGVAIDKFTNLAVIVDQANNRLLILQMPN